MLDLEPATRVLTDLLHRVRDNQLGVPTPCTQACLGDLIAHVDGLSIAFTAAATKTPPPAGTATVLRLDPNGASQLAAALTHAADRTARPDAG